MKHMALALALVPVIAASAVAGEELPKGPPWHRDFVTAHAEAVQSGKPIFVHFTKTYCPASVPVEKQLLPNDALKPLYDKIVWVYNYNDFKGGPADRKATRTRMRLSVSSYPQLLLVEPGTLKVVGQTGRSVESFLKAVNAARVTKPADPELSQRHLVAAEAAAERLARPHEANVAVQCLDSPDVAVRVLALQSLATKAPAVVAKRAKALLKTPNDLVRYEVCKVLGTPGLEVSTQAVHALESLVKNPVDSRNPNVLRIRAVQALAQCGRVHSASVIAEHAATRNYRNGLTNVSVDALAAIGAREPMAKQLAVPVLIKGLPCPVEPGDRMQRACTALARRIHGALVKLTGRSVEFPATYDAAARKQLVAAFGGK
jgi:hypothetical protein